MDDSARKIEELKRNVQDIQEAILFSAESIKSAVQNSSTSRDDLGLGSNAVKFAIVESRNLIRDIDIDLKSGFTRVESATLHVRNQIAVSTEMLIDAIEKSNHDTGESLVSATSYVPIRKEVQNTPLSEPASIIPQDFEKRAMLVMDSAIGFMKAWSNPVNVGVALAIPIIAGVGIVVGGVVLIFNKLVDAVVDISQSVRSIAEGGVKGLIFGQNVPKASTSTQKISKTEIDISPITNAVQESNRAVVAQLSSILTAVNAIEANSIEQRRVPVVGTDLSDTIERLNSAIQNNTSMLRSQLVSQPQSDNLDGARIKDREFQSEVLSLLKSTLTVRIDSDARSESTGEETLNVFSEAVRPLVRGQESLNRMLDSNMRKLIDAVNELRNAPQAESRQHITTLKDTVNSEMSKASTDYILSETKQIRVILQQISDAFRSFNQSWERSQVTRTTISKEDYSSLGIMDGN